MPIVRVSVTIPHKNNIARDACTNRFHFSAVNVLPATLASIKAALIRVYTQQFGGNNSLSPYIGLNMLPAASRIKAYDLSQPKPRIPVMDEGMALGDAGTQQLPPQVALVGSYQGALAAGQNRARRRGRFYLGPLSQLGWQADGTNAGRPTTTFVTAMNNAMADLKTSSDAAVDWDWVVYSEGARDNTDQEIPYDERPLLAPTFTEVTNGWTDNEFDTQRSRTVDATARTTWGV